MSRKLVDLQLNPIGSLISLFYKRYILEWTVTGEPKKGGNSCAEFSQSAGFPRLATGRFLQTYQKITAFHAFSL